MSKMDVQYDQHLKETLGPLSKDGLLLVTRGKNGKPNAMAIGWCAIGVIWGRPMCLVLVRPSRYTYKLLEESDDFTVNVLPPDMAETLAFCGTESGRDLDKFAEQPITPDESKTVQAPVIAESVIAYECKVVHKNDVIPAEIAEAIIGEFYPEGDFHRVYFGEILNVQAEAEALKKS